MTENTKITKESIFLELKEGNSAVICLFQQESFRHFEEDRGQIFQF